jgi:hypothetical protein
MDDPKSMVSPRNNADWCHNNRCVSPMQLSQHDELKSCRKSGGEITIQCFAGILALQLVAMAKKLDATSSDKFLPEVTHKTLSIQDSTSLSSPTLTSMLNVTSGKTVLWTAIDANGMLHYILSKI